MNPVACLRSYVRSLAKNHPTQATLTRVSGLATMKLAGIVFAVCLSLPAYSTAFAAAHVHLFAQDDPEAQCIEGVALFKDGRADEARDLLEAGFANREQATFTDPEDLGKCALVLGLLRDNSGARPEALEAYAVALEVFRESGNRGYEGDAHNNIGFVYRAMGEHALALEHYQQARDLFHAASDSASEANALNGIGAVYIEQDRYNDALTVFQEVLALQQEIDDRDGIGTTYHNIGVVHFQLSDYPTALEFFQQALALRREFDDPRGLARTLNGIGAVSENLGQYEEARAAHQEALAILRELEDTPGVANTLNNLGVALFSQGSLDEALPVFLEALELNREISDPGGQANALLGLGAIYQQRGEYEQAIDYFQQALTIQQEIGDRDGEASTLGNLGNVYEAQSQYDEALRAFMEALSICRAIGDRAGEANSLNGIGVVYEAQSRYQEALERYEQALDIQVEIGDRAGEATTRANIGAVYDAQGRTDEAMAAYQQSLSIRQEVEDRAGEGNIRNKIGSLLYAQGRYDQALEHFNQALMLAREVDDRRDEAETLNNIGLVHDATGDYVLALEQFQQALELHRQIDNREAQAGTLHNISGIYRAQGRFTDAIGASEAALTIAREIGDRRGEGDYLRGLGAAHSSQGRLAESQAAYEEALAITREIGDRFGEGDALKNLGSVYATHGYFAEALDVLRQSESIARDINNRVGLMETLLAIGDLQLDQGNNAEAINYYEQALEVLQAIRVTAGTEQARAAFIGQYDYLFERTVDVYLTEEQPAEAFFTSERARARTFLDSLATGFVQLDDTELEQLLEQEQSAYRTRQALQDALAQTRAQEPTDEQLVTALESDLAAAEATYNAAAEAIVARGDRLSSLIPGRGLGYVLGGDEVQAALPADTPLVSYYLYTDHNDEERAVAFVLTRDAFEAVSLPTGEAEVRAALEAFRGFDSTADVHPESLRQLYTWLIEPIVDQLNTGRLIIVPHGVLHYLPFAALTDGEQYLGERYVIATLPSASVLPLLAESKPEPAGPLVLGNPAASANLDNLPAAEAEARAVAELYNQQAYTGHAATESLVREQAGGHGVLHIASHADFNSVAPLQSGLYLAPDEANDGLLRVDEVYGLELTATDLVVLSACETNIGDVSPGNDIVALNRAFLFAGAPTVIASLWNVDDQATAILMTRFYSYLNEGRGEAEALRQAQIDLRTEYPEYAHPFYWAAFTLSGDGGEIKTGPLTTSQVEPTLMEPEPVDSTLPESTTGPRPGICPAALLPFMLAVVAMRRERHKANR